MVVERRIDRVVLTCGGTGGHVYPAVAIARELLGRHAGVRLSFVARPDSYEQRTLEAEGFDVDTVEVGRLVGQSWSRRLRTVMQVPAAVWRAAAILRRRRPDVVIGTGGFVSGPTMLAAALLRLPTLVQEQNAVPGLTNRLLRRIVRRVALAQAPSSGGLRPGWEVTGNPVRPDFFDVKPWREASPLTVLVMGGSQGARSLNVATVAAAAAGGDLKGRVRIVLQCGALWEREVVEQASRAQLEIEVVPYLEDVPRRLAAASLVVCRAGASTIAELCAAGRPAVLVPFPQAAGDHQTQNARALEAAGAACLIPDSELDGQRLASILGQAVAGTLPLEDMAARARSLARPGAAERIVALAMSAGDGPTSMPVAGGLLT